jgi:hypothetical protein
MRIRRQWRMAAMFVPNSREVNEIILLKGDQQGRRPHHALQVKNSYCDHRHFDSV